MTQKKVLPQGGCLAQPLCDSGAAPQLKKMMAGLHRLGGDQDPTLATLEENPALFDPADNPAHRAARGSSSVAGDGSGFSGGPWEPGNRPP